LLDEVDLVEDELVRLLEIPEAQAAGDHHQQERESQVAPGDPIARGAGFDLPERLRGSRLRLFGDAGRHLVALVLTLRDALGVGRYDLGRRQTVVRRHRRGPGLGKRQRQRLRREPGHPEPFRHRRHEQAAVDDRDGDPQRS